MAAPCSSVGRYRNPAIPLTSIRWSSCACLVRLTAITGVLESRSLVLPAIERDRRQQIVVADDHIRRQPRRRSRRLPDADCRVVTTPIPAKYRANAHSEKNGAQCRAREVVKTYPGKTPDLTLIHALSS